MTFSDTVSGIQEEERRRGGGEGGRADIKSNNPHLTGGKKGNPKLPLHSHLISAVCNMVCAREGGKSGSIGV